jgi:acetyl esterase
VLDPQIRAVLDELDAGLARAGMAAHEVPVAQAREGHDRQTAALSGPGEDVADVSEIDAGGVRVRLFRPLGAQPGAPLPLVVYLHGGGWVIGSLDSYDPLCRMLANRSGAQVASVDYRLAPEHPYPAAVEDSLQAFDWLRDNLGASRIAVAGDSAGGTLAAIVARRRPDAVVAQLLVYPVTDGTCGSDSYTEFAAGFGLTAPSMHRFWDLYAGDSDRSDPDLSPLCAGDLSAVAPAIVLLADHDVLHDEAEAYARRLEDAGVPVTLRSYPGTVHAFWRWFGRAEVSRRAVEEAGAALRTALA